MPEERAGKFLKQDVSKDGKQVNVKKTSATSLPHKKVNQLLYMS